MKGIEYKAVYENHSAKLSDITRQISFAGIAIIWVFKNSKDGAVFLDSAFVLPAILFVVALAFDLLQYLYQTITWLSVFSNHQRHDRLAKDVKAPRCLVIIGWCILFIKVATVIYAYLLLLNELNAKLIK